MAPHKPNPSFRPRWRRRCSPSCSGSWVCRDRRGGASPRHARAAGHPRIVDVLVYLGDPSAAATIAAHWADAQLVASLRLRESVSATWLGPVPGTYPMAIGIRPTDQLRLRTRFVPAEQATRTPPHVRINVDRIAWQVCDKRAWCTILDAWNRAADYLT